MKVNLNYSGIYAIKNTLNGKVYVGSAVNLRKRFKIHRMDLKLNRHHSSRLQNAWNKYGKETFVFDILEVVYDKANLILREQFWIDKFDSANSIIGYNICPIAGSNLGRRLSKKTRAKISKARTGSKWSKEMRARMVGRKQPLSAIATTSAKNRGRRHTPETIKKMSDAKKGKVMSFETRAKMSARIISDETKEKLRQAQTGKKLTPETCTKLSALLVGNKRTLGFKPTLESRAKMSLAQKERWARNREEAARKAVV